LLGLEYRFAEKAFSKIDHSGNILLLSSNPLVLMPKLTTKSCVTEDRQTPIGSLFCQEHNHADESAVMHGSEFYHIKNTGCMF